MNFTFGIVTNSELYIRDIVNSIKKQKIPNYEIIIVGGNYIKEFDDIHIRHIDFDETIKPMWITKKKNLITEKAKFDNIVYLHDYIILDEGWYDGFLEYGDDFKVCMTRMTNVDGSRFRDWHIGWSNLLNNNEYLIPYDMTHLSKYMYISGAYWIAKKEIMIKYPLDENKSWGEAEDAEWSERYKKENDFSINKHSNVKLLKYNDVCFRESTESTIEYLKKIK